VSAQAPTVLSRIVASARSELRQRQRAEPLEALRERALAARAGPAGEPRRSLAEAIARPPIGVIAEFKRRSPSAGQLREGAQVEEVVRAYELGGACALSVLTEASHFDGSLEDLRRARASSTLPILRKDFIVDPYQLYESLAAGADAVLLIVAALAQHELESLHRLAGELGLEALIEVHDGRELHAAMSVEPAVVGINNRDLRDFSVEVGRTERLAREVPAGVRVVSESGIGAPEQLVRLEALGVDAVLVGESLMRARDPRAALRELAGEGAPSSSA
jgi:indole-3-glycerol phosphate synthase